MWGALFHKNLKRLICIKAPARAFIQMNGVKSVASRKRLAAKGGVHVRKS